MRSKWVMKGAVAKVKDGAVIQRDYHNLRVNFWTVELDKSEAELKESGLTFEDAQLTGRHDVRAVIERPYRFIEFA